ncbi:hypothetical protein MtrunA17_Chr8g0388751 [Medicago truncatula]|uniref:Uncharacterized protein n=1 Tax=Medicago truncatula TaxID=3880 RepID=A0A396GQS8_MEDTR|nr:hypothetical protein MtrunA17_Chr8g0388751 [Medicago truncatula]
MVLLELKRLVFSLVFGAYEIKVTFSINVIFNVFATCGFKVSPLTKAPWIINKGL